MVFSLQLRSGSISGLFKGTSSSSSNSSNKSVSTSSANNDILILPLATLGAVTALVLVKSLIHKTITKLIQWLDPLTPSEQSIEFALYHRPLIPINEIERHIEEKHDTVVRGAERQIIWADETLKEQTQYSVVFIHGWGACRQECAPIPQKVAHALQANLYCARLPGHGRRRRLRQQQRRRQNGGDMNETHDHTHDNSNNNSLRYHPDNPDGDALLQEATPQELFLCAIESLRVGLSLGRKVILIGMSTGGCLSTWLTSRKCVQKYGSVAALVLISPAYALGHPLYPVLKTTFSTLRLVPLEHMIGLRQKVLAAAIGKIRNIEILSRDHVRYNCLTYPSAAVLHLLDVLWEMESNIDDVSTIDIPVLMIGNPQDHVINFRVTATNTFLKLGNVSGPNGSSKVLHCVTVDNTNTGPPPSATEESSRKQEIYGYHPHVIVSETLSPSLMEEMYTVIHKFLQSNTQQQQQQQHGKITVPMTISTREATAFTKSVNLERTRSVPTGMGSFASLPSLSDLTRPLLP